MCELKERHDLLHNCLTAVGECKGIGRVRVVFLVEFRVCSWPEGFEDQANQRGFTSGQNVTLSGNILAG